MLDPKAVTAESVNHISQTRSIVDLKFFRAAKQRRGNRLSHLIGELKAPNVPIGLEEVTQIQCYPVRRWSAQPPCGRKLLFLLHKMGHFSFNGRLPIR